MASAVTNSGSWWITTIVLGIGGVNLLHSVIQWPRLLPSSLFSTRGFKVNAFWEEREIVWVQKTHLLTTASAWTRGISSTDILFVRTSHMPSLCISPHAGGLGNVVSLWVQEEKTGLVTIVSLCHIHYTCYSTSYPTPLLNLLFPF